MRILTTDLPGSARLSKLTAISKEAQLRLKWFDFYNSHARNARLTCRHFGISPQTFYRWKGRFDPRYLGSLEDRSHRPERLRKPTWTTEQVSAVKRIREEYPRWGKDKLSLLLKEQGTRISVSMVGRILHYLKERGALKEPILSHVSARKKPRLRPYAVRKPKEYQAREVGDIVELDTLDLRPLPGVVLKHFTAHDVISKWNVLDVRCTASAKTAAEFLDILKARIPFPIKAIQVDGGSEFEALFEAECEKQAIRLFVLPPRSPKLNGGVERAHRTHTEEFYEVTDSSFELSDIRRELREWEQVYNTIRPHQALGYLTPKKYLDKERRKVSPII
jgi:putative transposase